MKLQISHVTHYEYETPVTDSVNEVRLTPSTNERQSCYQQSISIEPNASMFSYEDFFGNRVHAFSVNALHRKLVIKTNMTVVTKEAPSPAEYELAISKHPADLAWQWLGSEEASNKYAEFLAETDYTAITPEVVAFAGSMNENDEGERSELSIFEWLYRLCTKIKTEFIYDPDATNVKTTASEMFGIKRGVCQDFAHLMIASARSVGIPARYISGYHFVGDLQGGSADFEQASHAWVEALVPKLGWCSFDPTNIDPVGERYVKLGHGRDYKDIVPVKGVYRGAGEQKLIVTVDVRKIEE
ncbi:transglutaminase family protein [Paenibacillus sp. strain BS8-2]